MENNTPHTDVDAIIIGGGMAGSQAAIQLGRYGHQVRVIDAGDGRSVWCRSYHNILGWPDGISGPELRRLGRQHAERLGVQWIEEEAVHAEKVDGAFRIRTKESVKPYTAKVMLLATGIHDRLPGIHGLYPCLGRSIYICPDCDGIEVRNRHAFVIGSGNAGAGMALALTYFTDKLTYINHEMQRIDEKRQRHLTDRGITVEHVPVEWITHEEGIMQRLRLADGRVFEAEKAFAAFGGSRVNTSLGAQLGAERMDNRHILTDPRTKQTNVAGLWAAGDIGVHSEQVTIAMGEGSLAAIWMHKALVKLRQNQPVLV